LLEGFEKSGYRAIVMNFPAFSASRKLPCLTSPVLKKEATNDDSEA
jgi:hypothetical protein